MKTIKVASATLTPMSMAPKRLDRAVGLGNHSYRLWCSLNSFRTVLGLQNEVACREKTPGEVLRILHATICAVENTLEVRRDRVMKRRTVRKDRSVDTRSLDQELSDTYQRTDAAIKGM